MRIIALLVLVLKFTSDIQLHLESIIGKFYVQYIVPVFVINVIMLVIV